MKFLWSLVALTLLSALISCSRPENEIIKKAETLAEARQYKEAFDLVQSSLQGKLANNAALMRTRIRILLQAERVDVAYGFYKELIKEISKNDTVLIDALNEKRPEFRAAAARTLGLATDPATNQALSKNAVPALIKTLKDSDHNVRRAVVYALGTIKDTRATSALIEALQDSHWWVRSDAASALGNLRDTKAVTPLFKLLDDPDPSVRRAVENALGTLVRQPDISSYIAALNNPDPHIAHAAALSLAMIQNPAANPLLQKNITSPDQNMRRQSVRGMRFGKDPVNLPAVRTALRDPEWPVRGEALIALLDYRDKESLPIAQAMANDAKEKSEVKKIAQEVATRLQTLP